MRTLTLFAAFAVVGFVGAQAQEMAPPPELNKLAWTLGSWKGKIHFTMEGVDSEGDMTMNSVMDGMFIKGTTTWDMMGMKMVENAYMGWDEKAKCYRSWAFTNFSPDPRYEKGVLDGDTFSSTSEPWNVMGQATVGRGTLKKLGEKEISFTLEFKEGDKWTKVGEGKLTKQG